MNKKKCALEGFLLTGGRPVLGGHAAPGVILDLGGAVGALGDPGLVDVEAGGVLDLEPAAVLGLDAAGLGEQAALGLAEAHAAGGDGVVAGLLELVADLAGHLLLAEAHLDDGVVDGLADDLVRQVHELLGAGGDQVAAVRDLLLGEPDAVGALLVRRLDPRAPHHLHDLLLLVPDPPARVRVFGARAVLLHPTGAGQGGLLLAPTRRYCSSVFAPLAPFAPPFAWTARPRRVLDLLVENAGALGVVGHALEQLLLALALAHLVDEGLGGIAAAAAAAAAPAEPGIPALGPREQVS